MEEENTFAALSDALKKVDRGPSRGAGGSSALAPASSELAKTVTPSKVQTSPGTVSLGEHNERVGFIQMLRDQMFNSKMSDVEATKKDVSPGAALGLQAASAGLQALGNSMQIKENEEMKNLMMRDEFDMAFGAQEFAADRYEMAQTEQSIREIMDQLDQMQRQTEGVAAQTLGAQQQTFFRNTNTGGRI